MGVGRGGGYSYGASVRREERQLKRPLKVSELREGMNEAFLASLPAALIPPPERPLSAMGFSI